MGFQCQKVGGPKDMLAPPHLKVGGHGPPGPPASYATVKITQINLIHL